MNKKIICVQIPQELDKLLEERMVKDSRTKQAVVILALNVFLSQKSLIISQKIFDSKSKSSITVNLDLELLQKARMTGLSMPFLVSQALLFYFEKEKKCISN